MKSLASIAVLAGAATAQQSTWGQCGGNGWTGPSSCVSGSYCTTQNEWYAQCVPGAATTSQQTTLTTVRTTSVTTTSQASSTSTQPTTSGPASTATGFPRAVGTKFNIDGVTKYFAGTNCYWIAFLTNNADVDLALDHMAASGLKILRIWGFNDVNSIPGSGTVYFQYLSSSGSTINTGASGLQRLDYVVSSAAARGIKLIINFVNNWNDYGGMNAYVQAFGGSQTTWYTNSAAQAQYQAYIKAVVSRYKDSSAVFAWELANEPRCNGCSTDVIYNWARTTSAYIKSLDQNHMVTLGDEGFGLPGDGSYPYQYTEGVDWVRNLGISTLDFGTLHLYPSSWGTTVDWGNPWITTHAAQCVSANKPCVLEEYGMTSNHCAYEAPWQNTSLSTTGMASDLFWDFGDTLSFGQTSNDGNTIFYGTSDWTCLVTNHVAAIT